MNWQTSLWVLHECSYFCLCCFKVHHDQVLRGALHSLLLSDLQTRRTGEWPNPKGLLLIYINNVFAISSHSLTVESERLLFLFLSSVPCRPSFCLTSASAPLCFYFLLIRPISSSQHLSLSSGSSSRTHSWSLWSCWSPAVCSCLHSSRPSSTSRASSWCSWRPS